MSQMYVVRAKCGKGKSDPIYIVENAKSAEHAQLAAFFQTFGADQIPKIANVYEMTEIIAYCGIPLNASIYRTADEIGVPDLHDR